MKDEIIHLGATKRRTATNHDGHRVSVGRNVLRAGLNLVATDLRSVLPVFASILEDVMADGKRAICFHDDSTLQGVSSAFDVLNIGGTVADARLRESDGQYIAAYAIAHPERNIFVNLSELDSGSPARLIAEFGKAYKGGGNGARPFEIIAHYGLHRSITRSRDGIGDTRATHDAMRFQLLAKTRNIGILNAINSLSELPREFVTNCPNLAFGRIMLPKHYNELSSHVPEEDMARIRLCKKDDGYGVMKVPNGPLTYYPGSDVPNDIGRDMPFVLEPAALKSDIGKDPKDPNRPKRNAHLEEYTTFVDKERDRKATEAETARNNKIAERALRDLKDRAVKARVQAGVRDGASAQTTRIAISTTPRVVRRPRRTANDNAVMTACGSDREENVAGIVAMMLHAADVPDAEILSRHARKVLNAHGGLFNAEHRRSPSPRAIGLHLIGDALVREAILEGDALSRANRGDPISPAAVGAAYLEALELDEDLARRFIAEVRDEDSETFRRLRRIGAEASMSRREEAQFQIVRSAWAIRRERGSALPNAA